jgi:hypothetical protein
MVGMGTFILGGALDGIGKTLSDDAMARRAEVLAQLEGQASLAKADRDHQYRMEESRAEQERQRGLIKSTIQDANGNYYGITQTGEKMDLGIKGKSQGAGGDDATGLTDSDSRLLIRVENATKDQWGTVDKEKAAEMLRRAGRNDLAKVYSDTEAGGVDTSDPRWEEAGKRAQAEASAKAGWFSSDASDFEDSDGNRQKFITDRQQQIYQELRGANQGQQADNPKAKNTDKPKPSANGVPSGKGTSSEPYIGKTQADIDWFKTKAPRGAIIVVNGKAYTR